MKILRLKQSKIRTRIMLIYLALSVSLLLIFFTSSYFLMKNSLIDSLNTNLENTVSSMKKCLYVDGDVLAIDSKSADSIAIQEGIFIRIFSDDGTELYKSVDADRVFERTPYGDEAEFYDYSEVVDIDGHEASIEAVGNIYFNRFFDSFSTLMYALAPAYLLISAIGAYLIAKRALKPITDITSTANTIKAGDRKNRIKTVELHDEVGELASTINEMLDELDVAFEREKQFTSDASHELRTPVSVISACADEALVSEDESVIRENLTMIKNESGKMTKIIAQLLQLSRGYEGRYNYEPEEIALKDMVDSVLEVEEFEAQEKRISLISDVNQQIMVKVDQSLFTQVLMNIVGNAIKYGNDDGHVWVSAEKIEDKIEIHIKDDGIGMSQNDLAHIFERFYRADASRDRKGTGLGLAIVKWIVDIHQGEIEAKSTLGEGTEFIIRI